MTVALYGSIWLALAALWFGELGRRRHRQARVAPRWAIISSAAGVLLATAHTLLALAVAYDWNHARAVAVTAERAAAVYGIGWPGSLYVNYVFLGWWLADTIWWWLSPGSFIARSGIIEWLWRLTTFMMVINGAVIFASPAGRLAGVPLVVALVLLWGSPVRRPPARV